MYIKFSSREHAEDFIQRHRYIYYVLGARHMADCIYDVIEAEVRRQYGPGVWDTVGSSNPADYPEYISEGRRPNAEEREARDEAITQRILESL